MPAKVAVLMGSDADLPVMQEAVEMLGRFGVPCEVRVLSAHRSPEAVAEFARTAGKRGFACVIAGAGGAAHLAGAVAAHTTLPVIGVPLVTGELGGMDALLATVQMPAGVPVATVAVGKAGATNAALLAVEILAVTDESLRDRLEAFRREQAQAVADKDRRVQDKLGEREGPRIGFGAGN
jgi:phosphoribosylaminoimidazole carboxylase PurE protein